MSSATIDNGQQTANSATASSPKAKALFAEFGIRMAGGALDLFLALVIADIALVHVFDAIGLTVTERRPMLLVTLWLYFSAFWSSPLRATPAQLLLGMRVIDEAGNTLSFGRAALRSASLVGLIVLAMAPFELSFNALFGAIALAGYSLFFLAAITPNRQAAHDLLAHSIVANRTALKSPQRRNQLLQHVWDSAPASRRQRGPSILSILGNLFVLGVPLFMMLTVRDVIDDRDLRFRTNYAVGAVRGLQSAEEVFYQEYGRWPTNETELGAATREDFPDGGYYELEDNGAIRIRFTVKPALMKGSIVLRPLLDDVRIVWQCRSEGDLKPNHLPATCRD